MQANAQQVTAIITLMQQSLQCYKNLHNANAQTQYDAAYNLQAFANFLQTHNATALHAALMQQDTEARDNFENVLVYLLNNNLYNAQALLF